MKTLIELYDERPLENILATEVFHPQTTVFLCPNEVAENKALRESIKKYCAGRGISTRLVFEPCSLLDAQSVARQLIKTAGRYPDCALDISGGTDAALFAAGLMCAEKDIPVHTYSRKKNTFYNIRGAEYADKRVCDVRLSVEDCFLMAGGSTRAGRVDNSVLGNYIDLIDPFFDVYMTYRRDWVKIIGWFQRATGSDRDGTAPLSVTCQRTQKGERGSRVTIENAPLRAFANLGMLEELRLETDTVSFRFKDAQTRAWLRDVGSVLELYIWKATRGTGLFDDVRTSVIVDWSRENSTDRVTNEIDVMATAGVLPVFISCKTCDVKTEALNELAILRDRFGGESARAAIVTAERSRTVTRNRAAELGIDVIDLDDLRSGALGSRLAALAKVIR